ncbi:hypothetical protein L6164_032295 [Bauhinia variegata]|uniref:Uncharacterized protein n=1 Tax=Bauhinia variegata TaxID=167791 RepID=A0ACB9KN96_BAUVA|nr:hypothetical protein L6164_032295 [Bauhinia variegata]
MNLRSGTKKSEEERSWEAEVMLVEGVGLDDNFWQEAKQATLTVLGIILGYLVVAKGELLLAVIFNPLLYALRGTRNGLSFITSKVLQSAAAGNQPAFDGTLKKENYHPASAKDNVIRKWGSE